MRNVEVFGSVKIGIGDVYMQFGEPKTELQRSQKN